MDQLDQPVPTANEGIDHSGRLLGLLVFGVGVVLLLAVFVWSNALFVNLAKVSYQWVAMPVKPGQAPIQPSLVPLLRADAVRIALLFVAGYVASLIASKGIELFAASRRVGGRTRL